MTQSTATYNDAELIVNCTICAAKSGSAPHARGSPEVSPLDLLPRQWEKYPSGSDQNAYFRMVGTYWDMAASFVVKGILHEDLFFENSGEMLIVWKK